MSKILTISIAAYNVEKTIDQCLSSFLTSKYLDDIELLVINDGSTDKTAEIVSQYQEKFPNSIKLVNKENSGYGSTINTSLQLATGKYYKTIDGDDWVHADELDRLIECLRKTSADMIVNKYNCVFPDYIKISRFYYDVQIGKKYVFNELTELPKMRFDMIQMHATTVNTEKLRSVAMKVTEKCFYIDTEFIFFVALASNTIEFHDSCAYQYRLGRDGQSVSPKGIYRYIQDLITVTLCLMSLFNKIKFTLEEGYKKDYLFKVIESRYILIIKWYLLFIKKNDKDYLWADFRKKMDLDYREYVEKFRMPIECRLAHRFPNLLHVSRLLLKPVVLYRTSRVLLLSVVHKLMKLNINNQHQ